MTNWLAIFVVRHWILLLGGLLIFTAACERRSSTPAQPSARSKAESVLQGDSGKDRAPFHPKHLFGEVTAELGFVENPAPYAEGTFMAPEITPGGVAVFDFDDDGRLDILQVRHPSPAPWAEQVKASEPNRLFRQRNDGRFEEVPG